MGYNEVNGFSGGGGFEFINFLGKGLILAIDYQKGLQNQIPPPFSALKLNGKRLYEYARSGVRIIKKPRTITIYSINFNH